MFSNIIKSTQKSFEEKIKIIGADAAVIEHARHEDIIKGAQLQK